MKEKIRPAQLAGSWYEANPAVLKKQIESYLDDAKPEGDLPDDAEIVALIVPHAGHVYSGATAAHAYARVQGKNYDRVFLLGTNHRGDVAGIGLPESTGFATPIGTIPIDTELVARLRSHPLFSDAGRSHLGEHSIEIQLPFLQVALPNAKLVPLIVGRMTPDQIRAAASVLRRELGPHDLIVASSDFTHYGPNYSFRPFPAQEAPARLEALARDAVASLRKGDIEGFWEHRAKTNDTICGFLPISLTLAIMDGRIPGYLDKLDTSGHITNDYTNSVTYVAMTFATKDGHAKIREAAKEEPAANPADDMLTEADKLVCLRLARAAFTERVKNGRGPLADPAEYGIDKLPPHLARDGAAFVTLKEQGRLRGCIGSLEPRQPLWKDIVENGCHAAVHDYRFLPVKPPELDAIKVEVSVLTPPKEVSGAGEVVIGRDGVIIEKGGHRAVFLPQVAPEQGWGIEETLSHLSVKAGMDPDAWRSGTRFFTFQAQVFSESER